MLVPLSLGYCAVIDEADWPLVKGFAWKAAETKPGSGRVYAIAFPRENGRQKTIYMHRLLAGASGRGQQVDHADRDTLNNRRGNLRICSNAQNMHNSWIGKRNKSGYKGVCWCSFTSRWKAQIRVNGRKMFLGRYNSAEDAARAYDAAARDLSGEFARVNFA